MQRRLAAHAHRNVSSPDLNLRVAFKVPPPLPLHNVAAAAPRAWHANLHDAPMY
jgi:hypothetical protein